jgi:hypothetical protein
MVLDQLMMERKDLLNELKAYDDLQIGLEKIKRYNMDNRKYDKLIVYNTVSYPDIQEVTESEVAEKIDQLTNNLLKLSDQINNLKLKEATKKSVLVE